MIFFTQTSASVVVGDRGYFVESSNDAIDGRLEVGKITN